MGKGPWTKVMQDEVLQCSLVSPIIDWHIISWREATWVSAADERAAFT